MEYFSPNFVCVGRRGWGVGIVEQTGFLYVALAVLELEI